MSKNKQTNNIKEYSSVVEYLCSLYKALAWFLALLNKKIETQQNTYQYIPLDVYIIMFYWTEQIP